MYGIDKQSVAITVQHMNTTGEITPHLTADEYNLLLISRCWMNTSNVFDNLVMWIINEKTCLFSNIQFYFQNACFLVPNMSKSPFAPPATCPGQLDKSIFLGSYGHFQLPSPSKLFHTLMWWQIQVWLKYILRGSYSQTQLPNECALCLQTFL